MSYPDETYALGAADEGRPVATVRAWDLPTRIFKWSFTACVIAAWISSGFSDPNMTVHKLVGYAILVLVIYRFLWGIVGGSTARFASFVRAPRAVVRYLRALRAGRAPSYLGHNPAGGAMVLALLLACALQALVGLFASDGVTAAGPFADTIADGLSGLATLVHKTWFYVILGLAIVHIAANLFYQFIKGEDLIGAMITGKKRAIRYADAQEARGGSALIALGCLIAAIAIVYLGITLPGGSFFGNGL